jgi:hypothetical protein
MTAQPNRPPERCASVSDLCPSTFHRSTSAVRTASTDNGLSAMSWQRETIVGKRDSASRATSAKTTCGGGSSRVFNNAFDASGVARSIPSMIATRRRPSIGERVRSCCKARTWSILSVLFSGATKCKSGNLPAAINLQARHCPHGTDGAVQLRACASRRASVDLPMCSIPVMR